MSEYRSWTKQQPHTASTWISVCLATINNSKYNIIIYNYPNGDIIEAGKPADIIPATLALMGMEIPQEMTGKPLFIVK